MKATKRVASEKDIEYVVTDATMESHSNDNRIDMAMRANLQVDGVHCEVSSSFNGGYLDFQSWICVETTKGTLTFSNFIAPSVWHKISFKRKEDGVVLTRQVYEEGFPTYYYMTKAFAGLVEGTHKEDWGFVGMTDISDSIIQCKIIDSIYQKAGFPLRA